MKRLILLFIVISYNLTIAQVQTPQPSPFSSIKQIVGLTEFQVEYARPGVKGRKIFGDLVPFGELWRTGANKNTTINFNTSIILEGKAIKAGKYALFTTPGEKKWDIYLYDDTDNWGTPEKWDENKVVTHIEVKSIYNKNSVENFTISFDNLQKESSTLLIEWENTTIPISIQVPTDKIVMQSIEQAMKDPKPNDYFQAAVYYLETKRDINKAKIWIDKAIDNRKDKPFWMLRQQSLIYAEAGDKKTAIKIAKQSLEGAKKAGNNTYIKMNKKSLKDWGAL